jgi:hypothetical protein
MSDSLIESIQEIVSEINKAKRGSYPIPNVRIDGNTKPGLQATSWSRMFGNGFHLRIPGRIIIQLVNLGIAEPENGGFKVTLTRNGNLLVKVRFCGFTENVTILYP